MLSASDIVKKYISFFEARGHKQIANAPLVPINDPTTLFTSSGMQPLVPYLLGEKHQQGTRLVNIQNSFRAQDIEEVGDNRHTTFFRMMGNWSLGDYFKKEQLPWIFEFLTDKEVGLGLDPKRLYVTVFAGNNQIPKDTESIEIWKEVFSKAGIDAKEGERIFSYDVEKNWWSRSGVPEKMPTGEPGGPDSEVFYDFEDESIHTKSPWKNDSCHVNCDCGRYIEIANSVFMQYQKQPDGSFKELPKRNVDFGGGLERFLLVTEHQQDVFQTSLFSPIIKKIEEITSSPYGKSTNAMRIIADHLVAAVFIINAGVEPSKTEQGYILRRLIRRSYDNIMKLHGENILPTYRIFEAIVEQYKNTDPELVKNYEKIKNTILEEANTYKITVSRAKKFIDTKYKKTGDELMGVKEISAEDAFTLYTTQGLSPAQIESLGYSFDKQAFAQKMEEHQKISKAGADKKFRGGLADHSERTIMGHTATHLLHQALRDVLGKQVHQTGSNITTERVRFDFNYDKRLTDVQIKQVEDIVNQKIKANLPVHFELIDTKEAHKMGAIGLFMDTYGDKSKIYFIGPSTSSGLKKEDAYSIEFCGGPHVDFTGVLKSVKIIRQENLGKNQKRIYAIVQGN
ncbi:MAG: alanine--tRNA ligase [Candidatus Levybacteria bacterium]|nr:alanine--tRNA ligase [Candidatus Levybacteria bacterium]